MSFGRKSQGQWDDYPQNARMTHAVFRCLDCQEQVELYAITPDRLKHLALQGAEAMRLHIEAGCKTKPDPEEIDVTEEKETEL